MRIQILLFGITLLLVNVAVAQQYFLGADLSYVNEVEDCGAIFRAEGEQVDPYELFAAKGANLVRVRLWHNPDWTEYSDFEDVKKTIARSKKAGMAVLLDLHYSDTWADPGKQVIPAAWESITDLTVLGDSVYWYTYRTIETLGKEGLLPEMVQVGNETNSEILKADHVQSGDTINWDRNIFLLNRGLQAVEDISQELGRKVEAFIHIAQPENALWWFEEAFDAGIGNFQWIGLSYYPKWSEYGIDSLSVAIRELKKSYEKRIMIVETSYPYGLENADEAGNILGEDALVEGYPATPEGQLDYMINLTRQALKGGAEGVIYWEPAWVSSDCRTLWGKGSHWDNATFFDAANGNEALPAFKFYQQENYK